MESLLCLVDTCCGVGGLEEIPQKDETGTLSTQSPLMYYGSGSARFLWKSIMSCFVFEEFRMRLFSEHHAASLWTSSLYSVTSPPERSPTPDVPSANLMMVLVGWWWGHGRVCVCVSVCVCLCV